MWRLATQRVAASCSLHAGLPRAPFLRISAQSPLVQLAGRLPYTDGHSAIRCAFAPSVSSSTSTVNCRRQFASAGQSNDTAATGLRVKVHLKGAFDDGEVFDDSADDQPVTIVLGKGQVMPALDAGIQGMRIGEERELRVENAFGPLHDESRIVNAPRDQMPADCKVGAELRTENGQMCKVVALTNDSAKLDFSHPFAGKAATFTVKLVSCAQVTPITTLGWDRLSPGDGRTFPKIGDKVTVHYTGMLAETGASFDSSRARDQPFEFKIGVGKVIQGWDDGVLQMSLGERCELNIPYTMGYGVKGLGNTIPSSADLIFDVELLKIN